MTQYSMCNTRAELEAAARRKHIGRAGTFRYEGVKDFTKAYWLRVLDEPVDEYAEADHADYQKELMQLIRNFGGDQQ